VRRDAKWRGTFADTCKVFALVIDSDADRGRGWSGDASLVVETSPGNYQYWFFMKEAIDVKLASAIGSNIRASTGTDSDTGVPSQCYRVAGFPNYPNSKKRARGRTVTPTRIIAHGRKLWTADELLQAFPITLERRAVGNNARRPSPLSMPQIIAKHPSIKSSTRRELLGPGQIGRERRHRMHWRLANELREAGVPADEAFVCLKGTRWNKNGDDDEAIWRLVDKVWVNTDADAE